jgi:chromate reductase, NAD(P)H dehydrogenase (quinone)
MSVYSGLAEIPAFNPDLDGNIAPAPVTRLRAMLQACDAVLIASPEYAHGVPGALKNALDWIVGSGELVDKPIAVINTSARATHAWSSLVETLSVMSARVVLDASITLALGGSRLDADAIAADPAMSSALKAAIQVLAADAHDAQVA